MIGVLYKIEAKIVVLPEVRGKTIISKEALIKETVHGCDWYFAQNRGEKHSLTGGKASIFNKGSGQNNIVGGRRGFNQCFPNKGSGQNKIAGRGDV